MEAFESVRIKDLSHRAIRWCFVKCITAPCEFKLIQDTLQPKEIISLYPNPTPNLNSDDKFNRLFYYEELICNQKISISSTHCENPKYQASLIDLDNYNRTFCMYDNDPIFAGMKCFIASQCKSDTISVPKSLLK